MARAFLACCAVLLVAGCSSSSQPIIPTVAAARTFALSGFRPGRVPHPRTAQLTFTIRQRDGKPLTKYRTGSGPHTGVHLIVFRDDLSVILPRPPPIGPNGR